MTPNDEQRITMILEELKYIRTLLEAQNGRVRNNSEHLARLDERWRIWAGLQTALALVLSAVAAWLGMHH